MTALEIKELIAKYKKTTKPLRAKKKQRYKHNREGYDSPLYKQFVEAVKERDKNRCQMPGCTKVRFGIEVHHIFRYKDHPSMRFDCNFGICICRIPYSLIREEAQGFMDEAIIDKAKATMDVDRYNNEYETIKQRQSDVLEGDHCLYMVNFTSKDIRNELYYVNNKLMQDGRVKFPNWDTIAIEEAMNNENDDVRTQYLEKCANETALYDTIEDTYVEIQKTIDELISIKLVRTGATERFELPKIKDESTGLAKTSHADRAISLLLALLLYNRYLQTISLQTPEEQLAQDDPKRRNKHTMWLPNTTNAVMSNRMSNAFDRVNSALVR